MIIKACNFVQSSQASNIQDKYLGFILTFLAFFSPRLCLALLSASATPESEPAAFCRSFSVVAAAFTSASSSSSLSLTLLLPDSIRARAGEDEGIIL